MTTDVLKIIEFLGDKVVTTIGPNRPITKAESIYEALEEDSITFFSGKDLPSFKSKTVVCCANHAINGSLDKTFIVVKDPKKSFVEILNQFFVLPKLKQFSTISSLSPAKVGKGHQIGFHTILGKCSIGENVVIGNNVTIGDNVFIGNNVTIGHNTVIGSDGFGYIKDDSGEFIRFPHIGNVIIGDNVDIGCSTCIDRGALGSTMIGHGSKIDNLVHIAHNVKIGERSLVIANAMIGGSTKIGDNTWIAPGSALRDNIEIGNNVIVGLGAVVTKSIGDGETHIGNPARLLRK